MLALPDGSTKKLTKDSLIIAPGASFRGSLCPKKTYCVREFKSKINWDTLEASVKGIETILHEIGGYARNVENEDCEQMMADQNYRRKHPKLMENMLLLKMALARIKPVCNKLFVKWANWHPRDPAEASRPKAENVMAALRALSGRRACLGLFTADVGDLF